MPRIPSVTRSAHCERFVQRQLFGNPAIAWLRDEILPGLHIDPSDSQMIWYRSSDEARAMVGILHAVMDADVPL